MLDRSLVLPPLRRCAVLLFASIALAARPGFAATYALITPPSALEIGCEGPCLCAVEATPTYGSFDLVHTGSDPLFDYYDVQRYIASFNNGPGTVTVLGSGTYKIGGEVALTQEMTLDLEIEGRPVQHFDSGLVPVGTPFPGILVSCAAHGFACLDTVVRVSAKPVDVAGTPVGSRPAGRLAVWPNPFTSESRIAFTLADPGPAKLTIVDLAGRTVARLQPSAARVVTWDGRRDDGRPAPAGVYWVRLVWSGGVDQRSLIKLK